MNIITFKNCKNIKTFFNPYTGKIESIEFLQHISLLPSESEINFETNPRKQNYKTRTFQKIENSLFIPDRIFHKKIKVFFFQLKMSMSILKKT